MFFLFPNPMRFRNLWHNEMEMKIQNKICITAALLFCFLATGSGAAGFVFVNNLALGARDNSVLVLQKFLITGGFLKTPEPTGYFGLMTKNALGAWQASQGINPHTGFFGPASRAKMNAFFQKALEGGGKAPSLPVAGASDLSFASTTDKYASMPIDPVYFKIPKLGINAVFQYNGLKSDGTMEIPDNIYDVGWFTGSPRPGEKGSAVITGHVAQIRGGKVTKPGVFSNLSELIPGDWLYVTNGNGKSFTFRVRESRSYDPAADATDVFTSKDGGVHLNLITCEGTWNPAQLSYSQRLVIFTDEVK